MNRSFISVSRAGEVQRHEDETAACSLIPLGHTVIEIAPELAEAGVSVYELDEDGLRFQEIK